MKILLASLIALTPVSTFADEYQEGYSSSRNCFKTEYREEYIPGSKDNPGNVQSLIVGVGYFNILFICVVLFSIVINNYKNKNFLLTNLYKPKHY